MIANIALQLTVFIIHLQPLEFSQIVHMRNPFYLQSIDEKFEVFRRGFNNNYVGRLTLTWKACCEQIAGEKRYSISDRFAAKTPLAMNISYSRSPKRPLIISGVASPRPVACV